LTVTIHEIQKYRVPIDKELQEFVLTPRETEEKVLEQVCRYDFPLKMQVKPENLDHQKLAAMGYSSKEVGSISEKVMRHYKVATFNISKSPYILIPCCGSNVEIRMTISEVTEWPKAGWFQQ
jgi:hypothetical protein